MGTRGIQGVYPRLTSLSLQVIQDVEYQCVYCSIQADNENITVAAELSLINADQVYAKDCTSLGLFAKIC